MDYILQNMLSCYLRLNEHIIVLITRMAFCHGFDRSKWKFLKMNITLSSQINNFSIFADKGFNLDCSSSSYGMTITFSKKYFYFLPEHLTLDEPDCTSSSNSTHVWLYTAYNNCATRREV